MSTESQVIMKGKRKEFDQLVGLEEDGVREEARTKLGARMETRRTADEIQDS